MKILLALLLTIFGLSVYAQADSIIKFTLPELKITQLEKGKIVTYGFEEEENLFLLKDSLLSANPDLYKYKVLFSDLSKISIRDGTYSWRGTRTLGLIGGGIGLVIGGLYSFAYGGHKEYARLLISLPAFTLAGMLFGGLIGGLLGATMPYFENYDKFTGDNYMRREKLKRILKKHNIYSN